MSGGATEEPRPPPPSSGRSGRQRLPRPLPSGHAQTFQSGLGDTHLSPGGCVQQAVAHAQPRGLTGDPKWLCPQKIVTA